MGSIVSVSSKIAVTLFMVCLVYIPVFIAFGLFFHLSGNDAFNSPLNTVLKEGAMLTAGEIGIDQFFLHHPNHPSNSALTPTSDGKLSHFSLYFLHMVVIPICASIQKIEISEKNWSSKTKPLLISHL